MRGTNIASRRVRDLARLLERVRPPSRGRPLSIGGCSTTPGARLVSDAGCAQPSISIAGAAFKIISLLLEASDQAHNSQTATDDEYRKKLSCYLKMICRLAEGGAIACQQRLAGRRGRNSDQGGAKLDE